MWGLDFGGPGVVFSHVAGGVEGVLLLGGVDELTAFEEGAKVVTGDCSGDSEEDAEGMPVSEVLGGGRANNSTGMSRTIS